jgi:hypothetical protein
MLAPILGARRPLFRACISPGSIRRPKGKAQIIHPDTGEVLPAKKVRGSKAGGYIDLGGARAASRMIAGEGIETVAAVHTALKRAGRDLSRTLFRVRHRSRQPGRPRHRNAAASDAQDGQRPAAARAGA